MTHPQAAVEIMTNALVAITPYAVYNSEEKAVRIIDKLAPLLTPQLQAELDAANAKLAGAADALNIVDKYIELIRSTRPDGEKIRSIVRAALAEIEDRK